MTETSGKEPERQQPPHSDDGDSDQKSYFNTLNNKASEAGIPRLSSSTYGVSWCTHGSHAQASTNPASNLVSASLQKSQDLEASPLQSIKTGANTVRRALVRSRRVRKEVTTDTASFIFTEQSGETQRAHRTQESFRASQNNMVEEDNSEPNAEEVLQAYDDHWLWEESQDDVTFL